MAEHPDGLLEVGIIGRPHGVRGDVYVDLITDRVDRLDAGSRLFARETWLTVARSKQQQRRFLVSFEGIDDRETAARYTSVALYAEPVEDPDALWVHDLVGTVVRTPDGREHGTCRAVVANPASDLIELDDGRLIPIVFVVDQDASSVTVDVPPGLLDDEAD